MAKAPKKETVLSFADEIQDTPAPTVLDRSTLERWASCPWQAQAIADGRVTEQNDLLNAGNEIHDALSRTTRYWVESDGQVSPMDLQAELENDLRSSRPDVQPQVIAGMKASIYHWGQFLHKIHPANVLGFDGGEPLNRSGQLALDFTGAGVRVTSEIDLLYSGPSIELLHEVDYKTGHLLHTAARVAESFQFQFHAVLVFANFPEIRGLEVTAWNTRTNNRSYRVVFDRKKEGEYKARVHAAVASWYQNQADPPTWPAWDKCVLCPAAALCPVSGDDIKMVASNPHGALLQLAALEAKVTAWTKALAAVVDKDGRDIEVGGVAFGRAKPRERKANATVYKLGKTTEEIE